MFSFLPRSLVKDIRGCLVENECDSPLAVRSFFLIGLSLGWVLIVVFESMNGACFWLSCGMPGHGLGRQFGIPLTAKVTRTFFLQDGVYLLYVFSKWYCIAVTVVVVIVIIMANTFWVIDMYHVFFWVFYEFEVFSSSRQSDTETKTERLRLKKRLTGFLSQVVWL